jgi:hypothetical protein
MDPRNVSGTTLKLRSFSPTATGLSAILSSSGEFALRCVWMDGPIRHPLTSMMSYVAARQ